MYSEVKRVCLVGALAITWVGYCLYTRVPPDLSSSAKYIVRKAHAISRAITAVTWLAEQVGYGTMIHHLRSFGESKLSESQLHDDDVEVKNISIEFIVLYENKFVHAERLNNKIKDTVFDSVPVRIYRPKSLPKGKNPVIIYYHGGGWALSTVDAYHVFTLMLAKRTNTVVVSVEYRRPPEHVYPAAHDDCVKVAKYLIKSADQLNVDQNRIALCGDSAGGNLVATVALRLRDDDVKPQPKLQILIYPVTQVFDFHLPSMITHRGGPLIRTDDWVVYPCVYLTGNSTYHYLFRDNKHISPVARQKLAEYIDVGRLPGKYLTNYKRPSYENQVHEGLWNEIKSNVLHPYLSPLAAPNLKGLPQAYILTCEYDILRDEGILYALRLKDAGNKVTHVNWNDDFHAILAVGLDWPETQKMNDHMINYIIENL